MKKNPAKHDVPVEHPIIGDENTDLWRKDVRFLTDLLLIFRDTLQVILNNPQLSWAAKGLAARILIDPHTFADPEVDKLKELLSSGQPIELDEIIHELTRLETIGILSRRTIRTSSIPSYTIGTSWAINLPEEV
jgi:hypothetical protein